MANVFLMINWKQWWTVETEIKRLSVWNGEESPQTSKHNYQSDKTKVIRRQTRKWQPIC